MNKIGTLDSIWRYPVKSMQGEEVDDVYAAVLKEGTVKTGDDIYLLD